MTDPNQSFTDRNNRSATKSHLPCEVCGTNGAQTHYGGQCCVSCKMFFRRNSQFNLVRSRGEYSLIIFFPSRMNIDVYSMKNAILQSIVVVLVDIVDYKNVSTLACNENSYVHHIVVRIDLN